MSVVSATFKGGDRQTRVLAEIGRKIKSAANVKVGYLESATYPDGTPVAQVAFWQEFGTPAAMFPIPPRPTFRSMIRKHRAEWGDQLAKALIATGYDAKTALRTMGEIMRDELSESVLSADVAPLSEVTLMVRKMKADNLSLAVTRGTIFEAIRRVQAGDEGASGTAAKRLVSTGTLARSPNYEVIDGS